VKILILGSNGQLGLSLQDQFSGGNYQIILSSRSDNDVADVAVTVKYIVTINPDVIINASAYTAVDKAEVDEDAAEQMNHVAVANIANICAEIGCWFVHISTDYVFDGLAHHPYDENHEGNPQSVYGKTKLRGEMAVKRAGCKYVIIRTAWVFSEYGSNFLKTMIRVGAQNEDLNIVEDQIGCPTYAQDLAVTICNLLPLIESEEMREGIYHYCGDSPCSWYGFAQIIFYEAEKLGMRVPLRVHPIKTINYPTPAARPAFSVLDCNKIQQLPNIVTSDWRLAIGKVLKKIL
jgi:dTDP-4-dehydrorhamnose reductase